MSILLCGPLDLLLPILSEASENYLLGKVIHYGKGTLAEAGLR